MRSFYVFMVLVLLTLTASAQTTSTYRTENIDGINNFNQTLEKFNTTRAEISAYVTWDAEYLYIGYSGNTPAGALTDGGRAIHIYIDSDPQLVPTTGTGSTAGDAWLWNPVLPFTANYHYVFKTSDNSEIKRKYNGGGWGNQAFGTLNWKNTSGNYWEIRISRADLGGANAWNVLAYVEEDWTGGSAWISGGMPQGLFTNTQTQGPIIFNNKFLNVQFVDKMAPNAVFHQQNWGWSVKIKADAGNNIKDETAMAGMFLNATDGYDAGIDLPKPPTAPSGFVEVYFPRSGWGSAMGPKYERDFKLRADLSATTSTWGFTVNSDQTGNITLSAADFANVPSNYSIILKDLSNDAETNLRETTYTYLPPPSENTRNFELIIGVRLSDPTISVSPTSLDFGNVKTNASKSLAVTIQNTGDLPLSITNMAVTGTGYTYEEGTTTATLNTNDTIVRHIKLAPNAAGLFIGTFTITSNDPNNSPLEISLTGNGVLAQPGLTFYTDSLGFGSVIVGNTGQGSLWIGNKGGDGVALNISGVSITGTGASAFSYNGTTPLSIPAGDSLQLNFNFTPASLGYFGATIAVASDDPASPKSIPIGGTGTTSTTDNIFAAGWNLMSIPVNPTSNLASDILGDDITNYFLYKYSAGSYISSSTIDTTHGYWLGIEQAETVDVTGTPIRTDQTSVLDNGWNLIASPFGGNGSPKSSIRIGFAGSLYTIDEAVTNNWVQTGIYKYDNPTKAYQAVTVLSPWFGHWFFTLVSDLTIKYVYSPPSDFLTPKELPEIEVTPSNWFVDILSEVNGVKDNFLTFGTNAEATDGFDNRFDNVKPPISPASTAIESYFFQPDWLSLASKYASNIQAPLQNGVNKSWSFKVMSKSAGTYKLSWNDIVAQIPQEIRDNYSFILKGPGIANGINMLTQTAYEFSASAGATYSFVINSSPVGIDDEMMNLDFKLGQNYPNPFNPSTTISFSIKEAGQVTLKVYDILGNEVSTLINEVKQPGRYDVRFEAASLPSGTYFYKLVQGKNSEIKKLMLLK